MLFPPPAASYCFLFITLNLFFFLAAPHGLWDPSSLNRDQTRALGSGSAEF